MDETRDRLTGILYHLLYLEKDPKCDKSQIKAIGRMVAKAFYQTAPGYKLISADHFLETKAKEEMP